MTLSLVVLASGRGSNFLSILEAIHAGTCDARLLALISDNPQAPALDIARRFGVKTHIVLPADFPTREALDGRILTLIDSHSPDLVVLAGYMRILRSRALLQKYANRILNIHPSLLPKYPGAHAQKDAFEAGERVSGLTIHLVDSSLDGGPILYSEKVDLAGCASADDVSARILAREHLAYPRVIDGIAHGRYPLVRL